MGIVIRLALVILLVLSGMLISHYRVFPYHHLNSIISSPQYYEDQQNIDYFWRKVSHHQQWADQTFDVVLVGDSLTNEGEWQNFAPFLRVANMGINADTTEGVLKRIDVINAIDAPVVFLMIGVNDLLQGKKHETIVARYQKIIDALSSRFDTVYVQSCLYVGPLYQNRTQEIVRLNKAIQNLAEQSEQVTYLDLNSTLSNNQALNPAFTNDDVHLTGEAYQAWWQVIMRTLGIDSEG